MKLNGKTKYSVLWLFVGTTFIIFGFIGQYSALNQDDKIEYVLKKNITNEETVKKLNENNYLHALSNLSMVLGAIYVALGSVKFLSTVKE